MQAKLIKIIASQLLSEEGRKRLFAVIAFILFLIFMPLIILSSINPYSLSKNQMDIANDPYIKVQKKIEEEKKVDIDVSLLRAVDFVLFSNSTKEEEIEKRANKYYYSEKEIVKEDKVFLYDIDDTHKPSDDEKDIVIEDGKCYKIVENKCTVYVPKTFDEVISSIKNDINITDDKVKNINEIYQLALLNEEGSGGAGGNSTITENQEQFVQDILESAQKTYKEYGVFTSITLAQSILESASGSSELAKKANNLFGIKAYNWSGKSITMPTEEEYGGITITIMAAFRSYDNREQSIEDHAKFLKENSTYSEHGVFTATNYREQANALQAAGYATDSQYAMKLIQLIEDYKLYIYDTK